MTVPTTPRLDNRVLMKREKRRADARTRAGRQGALQSFAKQENALSKFRTQCFRSAMSPRIVFRLHHRLIRAFLAMTFVPLALHGAQPEINPSHIDVYVTPYYDSKGPTINVGRFSAGLASANENDVLSTIAEMKKDWDRLTFPELYVGAIRLYDLGYRREAVYWFYSAQYRGRQFGVLPDQTKMGSIGDPGFELFHAQNAFYQLVGPYINGYAFADTDGLVKIVERVQKEGRRLPDLQAAYPRVTFKSKNEWVAANADLADGMNQLISTLKEKKDEIKRQRTERGMDEKFSKLTSKELPSR